MNLHNNLGKLFILLAPASPALFLAPVNAQIAPGNLVVVRFGDGVTPLASSVAAAVFLDEYTASGALVQSIALPTAVSGANRALTNSGTATSEGHLNLSANCRYLVAAGYDAIPGTTGLVGSSSTAINRVIARVDLVTEAIDTTTSISNAFTANNIRSAASDDGVNFWAAGANSGINYVALGGTSATALNTTQPLNTRVVSIANGQLYCSSASMTFQGVSVVGTGLPNTPAVTVSLLPGFPAASGPSPYDFFFADADTLYVADDRTNGSGGIQKWTQSGGTWTLQYTMAPSATTGCRGLTGVVAGGMTTLFATSNSNQIVTVTDVGATSPFTSLVTVGANQTFRGIRLIPGNIGRLVHGCGPTTIDTSGLPSIGNGVTTTLGGVTGLPFIGLSFAIVSTPFCGCTVGHSWAVANFGASVTLNIPANPAYIGAQVGIQGADFGGAGGCPNPTLTFTDTMVVTVGGCF